MKFRSNDSRTDGQLRGSVTASAKLARQIGDDPMATPQAKALREALHNQMNSELTELENRQDG